MKIVFKNTSPTVNPTPWSNALDRSLITMMSTMMFTHGMNSSRTRHNGRFTTFSSTRVLRIGMIAAAVIGIIAMWVVFAKAGQPGWTAIIPILNTLVLLKVVKRPLWRVLLLFIPCVNIIVLIMVMRGLSKAFDPGVGFTVG